MIPSYKFILLIGGIFSWNSNRDLIYLFIFTFHGSLGGKPLVDIGTVNIDINTTQDVYTYEYKHGYEKNK